ncbi:MAG: transposase [Cytophagales bacterium]|nr:transposase [Cytophagales bacterium]
MLNSLLSEITKEFPNQKRSCLKNILLLSLCILQKESICLNKLKSNVGVLLRNISTQNNSHYKRLLRIFSIDKSSTLWQELLSYVFRIFHLKNDLLLLDGTSWQRGSKKYHFLTLCIVYKGVAIPIYWEDLNKKGQSNEKERNSFRQACQLYNLKEKVVIADREYIGQKWFKELFSCDLEFIIRIRKSDYKKLINSFSGKTHQQLSAKVTRSKKYNKVCSKVIKIAGKQVQFIVTKNQMKTTQDDLLYLLCSSNITAQKSVEYYQQRWKIECCFKHLKSNGVDLQKMNLKEGHKIQLMMAIVIFSYALSINQGLKEYNKVPYKTYKNGTVYKAVSVFKKGLQEINLACRSFENFIQYLIKNLHQKVTYRHYANPFVQ